MSNLKYETFIMPYKPYSDKGGAATHPKVDLNLTWDGLQELWKFIFTQVFNLKECTDLM